MAFLGPLAGGIASGISAISGMGAQQDANNINWLNLFETKRRNRKTEQLATATREDAYGNKMTYTPGIGWEIDTTPMTEAIMGSQQNEELRQLREDAPRNRAAAERKDTRSRMGDEEFQKKFNEFRFRPQLSEEGEVADATQDVLNARRKGLDEASAMLARQLMRTGGSSELASVYKQADDTYAGSLEDAILKGKQAGRQRFSDRNNSDLATRSSELNLLRGIADDTTTSPVGSPADGYNNALSNRADNAMQQLIAAMQSGTASNQNASNTLASGVARSGLNLSGLASALGRLDFSGFGGGEAQQEDPSYAASNDPWAGLRSVGKNQFFG